MKKITLVLTMLLVLVCSVCSAFEVKQFLYNDRNYPCVGGHMGVYSYANLYSVNVERYSPPEYIISVDVLTADADKGYRIVHKRTCRFYYDYKARRMYDEATVGWAYIPRSGSYAETNVRLLAGEYAFEKAYNMPFYPGVGHY